MMGNDQTLVRMNARLAKVVSLSCIPVSSPRCCERDPTSQGTPSADRGLAGKARRKPALGFLPNRMVVKPEAQKEDAEHKARPQFADLLIVNGNHVCPQGTSKARHVATLAGLKTRGQDLSHYSEPNA
jgi:hypothetical protein